MIENRSLLEEGKPNVFLLEADIDEQGNVHKIVELNGALRQYSQIFIDKLYDMAVRGWQPAKKDGRAVPYGMPVEVRADAVVELYDTVVRPPEFSGGRFIDLLKNAFG